MFGSLQSPLAVVAHDAGAANHIIAWLKNTDRTIVRACMAGPALTLWRRAFPEEPISELSVAMAESKTLISGTGWADNLEHDSRRIARDLGIRSIAVIDHWTSYRERFVLDGVEILPDEIWVADEYAKTHAEREFSGLMIVQLPNLYLEGLVHEVQAHARVGVKREGKNLLYVLEPIRQSWGSGAVAGEFQGLDFFAQNIGVLRLGDSLAIRLRPHPSDPSGKYDPWIRAHGNLSVTLDDTPTLSESIAWSDVVIGCQTYAMVIALAAGKRVITSIPPWAPPCILPQSGIFKLSDFL